MGNISHKTPNSTVFAFPLGQTFKSQRCKDSWPWKWNWLQWVQDVVASPSSTASTSSLCLPKAYANIQRQQCIGHSTGASPGIGDSATRDARRPVKAKCGDTEASLCRTGLGAADAPRLVTSCYCPASLTQTVLRNTSLILLTPQISFLSAKPYHMQSHICEAVGSRPAG